ncbi:unnamed protein product [Chironomus riparius]|uniref:Uncharacterized protein n=1 Tax=Chironomus riparius TaxID=315576 RepID=A0A9N9WZ92_9DIPT|nr:unnamed protein product [Chironomus riparius]
MKSICIVLLALSVQFTMTSSKLVEFTCNVPRNSTIRQIICPSQNPRRENVQHPIMSIRNIRQSNLNHMELADFNNYDFSEYLPSRIGATLPRMKHFLFRKSSIKFLRRRDFMDMRQLQKLNLSFNKIGKISHEIFYDLPHLELLDIRYNEIYNLPSDLLSNAPRLKIFIAEGNLLEEVSHKLFRNNKQIEEIHLGHNEILNIDVRFTALKNLRIVDLRQNVGECDIMLKIFRMVRESLKTSKRKRFQLKVRESCAYVDDN